MLGMKDIAREAGVSRPTVSLVLNGKAGKGNVRISEETKKRVFAAAEKLGYCRNEIARSMITGKTCFIGFMSNNTDIEYTAKNLSGAISECQKYDYFVKIFPTHTDENNFEQCLKNMIGQRPAGIICRSPDIEQQKLLRRECGKYNIPVALIGSIYRGDWGIRVLTDDAAGAAEAAKLLIRNDRRKLLCVCSREGKRFSDERYKGFAEGAKNAGLRIKKFSIPYSDDNFKNFEKELLELLKSERRPDGIFCVTDELAMIVLRVTAKAKLKVPEDLSVIGFADMRMAAFATPPLTTVAEPFEEIGTTAARELLKEIKSASIKSFKSPKIIELSVKMKIRESVAMAKK